MSTDCAGAADPPEVGGGPQRDQQLRQEQPGPGGGPRGAGGLHGHRRQPRDRRAHRHPRGLGGAGQAPQEEAVCHDGDTAHCAAQALTQVRARANIQIISTVNCPGSYPGPR